MGGGVTKRAVMGFTDALQCVLPESISLSADTVKASLLSAGVALAGSVLLGKILNRKSPRHVTFVGQCTLCEQFEVRILGGSVAFQEDPDLRKNRISRSAKRQGSSAAFFKTKMKFECSSGGRHRKPEEVGVGVAGLEKFGRLLHEHGSLHDQSFS